ncbi:DUF3566 domain-containing protein [Actinomyces slackii]|uniref:Transmembrane domain of uncharacterized function (DUF3566) n=1 Tax=Actinomyces slackii TaxID=52774 RepID=A0A3S4WFP6_9ACTO|nr:DUF3566 domain-containing protein [Actinomyces slackii]VEG73938.1 Transmembrane domain of uncharacterised function (DUF3566) [Actinomyces slackii]
MSQPLSIPPGGGQSPQSGSADSVAEAVSADKGKGAKKSKKTIAGPRRVRLALTRVDPWSVMKASLLLSFAAGIMMIVATAFVWFMLDAMHVFSTIKDLVGTVAGDESNAFKALVAYLELPRALSMATITAVVNMVLMTALATVGAFLYNITATLVGGIHLTLADE